MDSDATIAAPGAKNPRLKYLFTGVFADGTSFSQGEDDVCSFDPKKSPFYELQELMKTKELALFILKGDEREIILDLRTGHFQIDTLQFFVNQEKAPRRADGTPVPLKLIYYRSVDEVATLSVSIDDVQLIGSEKKINAYCFGWEANLNGRRIGPCIFGVF